MAATRLGVFGTPWHDLSSVPVIRIVNETADVAEGVVRAKGLYRVVGETVQVAESLVRILQTVFSQVAAVTKLGVYGVSVGVLTATAAISKVATEAVQVIEASAIVKGELQIVSEVLSLAESIVNVTSGSAVKVVNETVQIAEGVLQLISEIYTVAIKFTTRIRRAVGFSARVNEEDR